MDVRQTDEAGDYVVPNVLSKGPSFQTNHMDETVLHTLIIVVNEGAI